MASPRITDAKTISTASYIPENGEWVMDLDNQVLRIGDGVRTVNNLDIYSGVSYPETGSDTDLPLCRCNGKWYRFKARVTS